MRGRAPRFLVALKKCSYLRYAREENLHAILFEVESALRVLYAPQACDVKKFIVSTFYCIVQYIRFDTGGRLNEMRIDN